MRARNLASRRRPAGRSAAVVTLPELRQGAPGIRRAAVVPRRAANTVDAAEFDGPLSRRRHAPRAPARRSRNPACCGRAPAGGEHSGCRRVRYDRRPPPPLASAGRDRRACAASASGAPPCAAPFAPRTSGRPVRPGCRGNAAWADHAKRTLFEHHGIHETAGWRAHCRRRAYATQLQYPTTGRTRHAAHGRTMRTPRTPSRKARRLRQRSDRRPGHPEIDRRVLELTRFTGDRIDENPALVQRGLDNIERWARQNGGSLLRGHAEWQALIRRHPCASRHEASPHHDVPKAPHAGNPAPHRTEPIDESHNWALSAVVGMKSAVVDGVP